MWLTLRNARWRDHFFRFFRGPGTPRDHFLLFFRGAGTPRASIIGGATIFSFFSEVQGHPWPFCVVFQRSRDTPSLDNRRRDNFFAFSEVQGHPVTIFVGFQRSRDTPNLNNLPQLSFIRFQWNVFEHKCLGCPGNMIPQDLIFIKKKYGAIPSVEGNTLASKSSSPGIDSLFQKNDAPGDCWRKVFRK